jgi:HSP20 family molecular chaperone IbpA
MTTMTATKSPASPQKADRREAPERATRTVMPPVDIYEVDKAFVLVADIPGVHPEGLEVVAERDTLTIRGRVERPAPRPDYPDYQEFELADYYRAFNLTEDLDTSVVTATLRDGVLRVEIPKSAKLQPKKIAVRTE